MKTQIQFSHGRPFIAVDGVLHAPLAYTTYFEERGEYADFIKSGYKMFFVNISFTDLPINNVTGFTPFRTGVFETDVPDYSEFNTTVRQILALCPDAFIFPRINVAMPKKWIAANPDETVETPTGRRESLYSDAFLRDGAVLLKELVSHMRTSDYAHRIAGYQLCGGTTQEWMHHDMHGSFSDMGLAKFRGWLQKKYEIRDIPALSKSDFSGNSNETVSRFEEFCCEMAAKTVEHFAKVLKECTDGEQITGVFYGYNAFVNDPLLGLHGLRHIISSPYIDFFSSPCCYDHNRSLGVDWGDMLTAASVKHHDKLYFVECDIRTHLTRRLHDARPGQYPDGIYELTDNNGNKTVWCGPDTAEFSLSALRKAFAHQLVNGSGIWWFDMWGGWYHEKRIMDELQQMRRIAENATNKNTDGLPCADTVLFIDESAYANIERGNMLRDSVNRIRVAMGNTGIAFDLCMVEDAKSVLHKYRAAVFTAPVPSDSGKKALQLCKDLHIPYLSASAQNPSYNTRQLRDFLIPAGAHCYNANGHVVYCGNGFLGIHAVNDGEIRVALPMEHTIRPLLGTRGDECVSDTLCLHMKKHETAIFEVI